MSVFGKENKGVPPPLDKDIIQIKAIKNLSMGKCTSDPLQEAVPDGNPCRVGASGVTLKMDRLWQ